MGRKRGNGRRIIMNYTGEVSAMDIRLKIVELYLENRKRGIAGNDGMHKQQYRNICKGKQG